MNRKEMRATVSMLRRAADQMAIALDQLQSERNDGWVCEYYRETLASLREELAVKVSKLSQGDAEEQLLLLDSESNHSI